MASIKLEFSGFDAMLKKLNEMEADTKGVVTEALQKSFDIVTKKAEEAIQSSNLPAQGKYSSGRSEKSLVHDLKITWKGTEATAPVGFNIKKGGLPTIFMMYGTPRYMKNQKLYDAFYSDQTEGEVLNAQKKIFEEAVEKLQ